MIESIKTTVCAFVFLFSAQAFAAKPAPSAVSVCDVKKLKASTVPVFQDPKSKTKWISESEDSQRFFSALGFERLKGASAKVDNASNLKRCPADKRFRKIYASPKRVASLIVANPCEENLARALGLSEGVGENYGSMEAENLVPWSVVNVCTDGTKLYSCPAPTQQMAKCLAKL